MIKGVNRQVVEVSHTDSIYFEKVLFFVRPEYYGMSENKLKEKADAVLCEQTKPAPNREKKNRKNGFRYLIAACGGAAVSAIAGLVLQLIFQ
ncbi:MAG: hypothetical protein IJO14_13120 [Clostridia bacterium]|nr:hypothetical protein [Clostridia bacterium]